MKHILIPTALMLAICSAAWAADLKSAFLAPPDAARPGVYWYFMDGNQNREEMVADLRAMKQVGIGSVVFLEVDLGMPRGPIPFMSEQWQENVSHAFVEAGKLGMEVILGTGPGWSGSGASWVRAEDSMQHLVGRSMQVSGPAMFDGILEVPSAHVPNPYAGMNEVHSAERDAWYQDVAVIAFPTLQEATALIDEVNIKTLKDVLPYSIRRTQQRFVMPEADYHEPASSQVIDFTKVLDLTASMQVDGHLQWEVPAGDWTVMRFVARSTGQTSRPAPRAGHGFETNKFDGDSYRRHWDQFHAKILKKIIAKEGPLRSGRGLTTIHLDSWEMSSQNWTAGFREAFQQHQGYDPQPFYPAYMGQVVGSLEQTERFLWDMRKTAQQLVLGEYADVIKQTAHEHGLLYSNEPYDMNPAGDLDLGSLADIPMCEFWNAPHDTQYSCIEATSIAHTMGQQMVKAEAFTSSQDAFAKHPSNMKNQTDWAFAIGINGIVFHTYQHQALGDKVKPGMTMGRYGIQWHRNQTFWDFLPDYHAYITRCSHLLRQGEAVADILYLTPEGVPHIFAAPEDATEGAPRLRDKKGYSFDAVSPRILAMRAHVENGRIAFPDGSKYRVLVLPQVSTMTPEGLKVIKQLVEDGATVIGHPPMKSPSLVNYPVCDAEVVNLATSLWGDGATPVQISRIAHGKGEIYWGGDLEASAGLYPSYRATAALLAALQLPEDFTSPSGNLRFIHRETEEEDIYFVSNRTEEAFATEGSFRLEGRQPQLWDPVTAETRSLGEYTCNNGVTRVALSFAPLQSVFVIFPKDATTTARSESAPRHFQKTKAMTPLAGAWRVSFDPAWGGPADITFEQLEDWSKRPEEGIRHYSGIATYRKSFDFDAEQLSEEDHVYLDLGTVHDLCRVRLNGHDLGVLWTAPWRVNITSAVNPVDNQLEIEVVNGWVNRLIGDAALPDHSDYQYRSPEMPLWIKNGDPLPEGPRQTFTTFDYYKNGDPLLPAGLLGSVRIITEGP